VAGFSLFDKIRHEDSCLTKTEGTNGVRYDTWAKLFYGYTDKLNGIGNTKEDIIICLQSHLCQIKEGTPLDYL
jgi:hypothetical protein